MTYKPNSVKSPAIIASVPSTISLNGIGTESTCDNPQRSNQIPKTNVANVFADLIEFLHFTYGRFVLLYAAKISTLFVNLRT